jgi:hypothetical protein
MELYDLVISEVRQTQKEKYHMFPLSYMEVTNIDLKEITVAERIERDSILCTKKQFGRNKFKCCTAQCNILNEELEKNSLKLQTNEMRILS